VYYSLTSGGRRHLKKITQDWRRISGGVDAALLAPKYA
jgi:DNA-binding PadR family transcriptional regulator